jgi:hypothetical protein
MAFLVGVPERLDVVDLIWGMGHRLIRRLFDLDHLVHRDGLRALIPAPQLTERDAGTGWVATLTTHAAEGVAGDGRGDSPASGRALVVRREAVMQGEDMAEHGRGGNDGGDEREGQAHDVHDRVELHRSENGLDEVGTECSGEVSLKVTMLVNGRR